MASLPRRIGVLTSGGDAPGMNACLRAIVRTAVYHGLEIIGFERGYCGVLLGEYHAMDARSVANIIHRGGTILGSARCPEMQQAEGVRQAAANLKGLGIDALLTIGGNGTIRGAAALADHWPGQVIGLPGTIDNDLGGTDWTIGFFTALDTALDAVDRLRDTAEAFDRIFLVEVMGRHAGWIAMFTGIGGGAEQILVPEQPYEPSAITRLIRDSRARGKRSHVVVVAEGACEGGVRRVAADIERDGHFETRTCVLGHVQRGGSPAAMDRYLATDLGVFAVQAVLAGETRLLVGKKGMTNQLFPFAEALEGANQPPTHLLEINRFLVT